MATPTRPCPYCGQQVLMTAPHCGYCGRPLPAAAAPPAGGLAPPAPGGRSAYPPPAGAPAAPQQGNAKTMFGYAPPPGQAWPPSPGQAPAPSAPPQQAAPPAPAPAPWGAPPQQAPAPAPWGAPPQQAPAPAPWGAPQQAAPPPAQPWQQPPQGAPPAQPWQQQQPTPWQPPPGQPPQQQAPPVQAWQPAPQQGAPPAQPWQQPPQGAPPAGQAWQTPPGGAGQPWQQAPAPSFQPAGHAPPGAAPAWAANVPQVDLSQGLKFLRDQAFEKKAFMIAAIALVVTRFIPFMSADKTRFVWDFDDSIFPGMILPVLAALIYGAIVFLPDHLKANIPRPALKWAPFAIAFFGSGFLGAAVPLAIYPKLMGSGASMGGWTAVAWMYPVLLFGLVVRLQDPNDKIARGMIGVGGLIAVIGVLTEVGSLFKFSNAGAFMIIYQLLAFLVLLVMLGALVFAVPSNVWPPAAQFERFLPLTVLVLTAWVPVAALLVALEAGLGKYSEFINLVYALPQMGAIIVGFLGILLLTAPEAFDSIKSSFAPPQGGGGPPPGYGPPPGQGGPPPGWQQPPQQ